MEQLLEDIWKEKIEHERQDDQIIIALSLALARIPSMSITCTAAEYNAFAPNFNVRFMGHEDGSYTVTLEPTEQRDRNLTARHA